MDASGSELIFLSIGQNIVIEIGKESGVGREGIQIAKVEPLIGKIIDQRYGARIGQHAARLFLQGIRIAQFISLRSIEQFIVGDTAPEEEGETRGEFDAA